MEQNQLKNSGKVGKVKAVKAEAQTPQPAVPERAALVGVVMGSKSDYDILSSAVEILKQFDIPYEARVVSAHRTPDWLFEYAETAESRGLRVIIAGAGGAAHLPGMLAAKTLVPVLGVPVPATMLNGIDSLLSIVQMPKGIPVGTLAIGKPGATNAALFAAQILGITDESLREKLRVWREARRDEVLAQKLGEEQLS
jgi:5-(carboxyamino)imidazole ribonucleotide mutase